jgi:outer membrane lipoprotein carrier protein
LKVSIFPTVKQSHRTNCLVLALFLPGFCADLHSQSVKEIAGAVDQHYNHLRSMQANFTEVYKGAGIERTEAGTLWLKKPGKMRWEYRSPKEKLFVSDGKDVWLYVPDQRQVRKMVLKKLEDLRSPIAFLLGKSNLQKELQGLSSATDQTPEEAGNTVLRGIPVAMADRVEQILLEVNPQRQIVRISVTGTDGSTTEYRFTNLKENEMLADGLFRFSPPGGVELIQGDLGP